VRTRFAGALTHTGPGRPRLSPALAALRPRTGSPPGRAHAPSAAARSSGASAPKRNGTGLPCSALPGGATGADSRPLTTRFRWCGSGLPPSSSRRHSSRQPGGDSTTTLQPMTCPRPPLPPGTSKDAGDARRTVALGMGWTVAYHHTSALPSRSSRSRSAAGRVARFSTDFCPTASSVAMGSCTAMAISSCAAPAPVKSPE
jgi:hypothetical protein